MATKAKRIPKLRRLLKLMGACPQGRAATRNMTLSEAWEKASSVYKDWFSYRLAIRLTCVGEVPEYSGENRALIGWTRGWRKPRSFSPPAKLPASLLALWDGYEPPQFGSEKLPMPKKAVK